MKKENKKSIKKINKTLKKKITNYICDTKEKDICCESEYNREQIVGDILEMYKERFLAYENEYLEWICNDIFFFFGFNAVSEKVKNIKVEKMYDLIVSKTKKISETNTKKILMELPLYFLLAFLGRTYVMRHLLKTNTQ